VGWWCIRGGCGGGVVRSQNPRPGGCLGQKNQNRATVAQFRTALGLQEVERGAVGLRSPPCHAELEWGWGVKWYGGWW
jgi:hypothetical protein